MYYDDVVMEFSVWIMCCILNFNVCGIKFVLNLCTMFWILMCVDYVSVESNLFM
jgi:hypothetical protein